MWNWIKRRLFRIQIPWVEPTINCMACGVPLLFTDAVWFGGRLGIGAIPYCTAACRKADVTEYGEETAMLDFPDLRPGKKFDYERPFFEQADEIDRIIEEGEKGRKNGLTGRPASG